MTWALRQMEPRDLPRVWSAARAQNRRDGTSYPVPDIFDLDEKSHNFGKLMPNVVLALVTEVDGRVRMGHVWIRTIEEMHFGGGREIMQFSIGHMEAVLSVLKARGYLDNHIFVPKVRLEDLETELGNHSFARVDGRLAHFFRML